MPQPLYAQSSRSVFRPKGTYRCTCMDIEVDTRTPFGRKEGSEPCFVFAFHVNEESSSEPNIEITTGTNYGNPKAKLTQVTDMMAGRSFSTEDIAKFDYRKEFTGKEFDLRLTEKRNAQTNEQYNEVTEIDPVMEIQEEEN